jgi:hypothetical protein
MTMLPYPSSRTLSPQDNLFVGYDSPCVSVFDTMGMAWSSKIVIFVPRFENDPLTRRSWHGKRKTLSR